MHPRARPDLTARAVDGEAVLLDRAGGRVHQFNPTASFVWSRLDGRTSPEELAAAVAAAFEVDAETAGRDVGTLLEQLRVLDLLAPESPGGGGE